MATRDPYDYFYGEVLHLAPGTRDPDHYTLLGLPFFEKSAERIRRAGHDRKRALRAAPQGPPGLEHVRRELVERVREARRTLLDPERREAYDGYLVGNGHAPDAPEFHLDEGAEFAGRFRILKDLRRGGFGRVYAALDREAGLRVELTVMPPSKSRELGRRAAKAARALAALDVPGVVPASGVGEAEGLVYAHWPAPEGTSLSHRARAPLDPDEAAPLADRLAGILRALHERGLAHGDLNARNVFVTDDGSVEVAECGLAAAVAEEAPSSPYSAPERAVSPAADRYALGALAYLLLSGEAPFLAGRRALVPKPLPDNVPLPLARTVLGLLAREPGQRIEEPRFTMEAPPRRRPPWAAVAALGAVVAAGVLLALGGDDDEGAPPVARAWELIGERRFAEAIALLESGEPGPAARAPLASALEGEALRREAAGDPHAAQRMLARAQALSPNDGRAAQFERIRARLRARLDEVPVKTPPVAREVVVTVEGERGALSGVVVGGEELEPGATARLERPEGAHEITFRLEDPAGIVREGTVRAVVDKKRPKLIIEEPREGHMQRDGGVDVRVRIEDDHPPENVTIGGRRAAVEDGVARLRVNLGNGRHVIDVRATDRAGNEAAAAVSVVVDDRAPEIELERERIVARAGAVAVRGRVRGIEPSLSVGGRAVELDAEGRFETTVTFADDTDVELVARGPTGVVARATVSCVRDVERPVLEVSWPRRGPDGRMLYGGGLMDEGVVPLRLRAEDDTALRIEPSAGSVDGGIWAVPARAGAWRATLRAVDEAGNETTVAVELEGRRASPRLEVSTPLGAVTRDDEAVLSVDADETVYLGTERIEPGRVTVPLPEGEREIVVHAVDAYGNTTTWRRRVLVDRTPPDVKVVGPVARGVGVQEVVFEASEELASIACLSGVKENTGRRVAFEADLEAGRTHVHVVARDRAGNTAKLKLPLQVVNRVLLLDGKSALRVPLKPAGDDFTVEFWARGTPAIDPAVMLSRGVGRGWRMIWASEDEPLPHALVEITGEGPMTMRVKKMRETTEWHHYALVKIGEKFRFYLDGKQQAFLESNIAMKPGESRLLIGGSAVDDAGKVVDGFIGRIDELRISEGARYVTRAFRPERFHGRDDRTRLLLRFDLEEGGKHPDTSVAGLHGTAVGAPRLVVAQD